MLKKGLPSCEKMLFRAGGVVDFTRFLFLLIVFRPFLEKVMIHR